MRKHGVFCRLFLSAEIHNQGSLFKKKKEKQKQKQKTKIKQEVLMITVCIRASPPAWLRDKYGFSNFNTCLCYGLENVKVMHFNCDRKGISGAAGMIHLGEFVACSALVEVVTLILQFFL